MCNDEEILSFNQQQHVHVVSVAFPTSEQVLESRAIVVLVDRSTDRPSTVDAMAADRVRHPVALFSQNRSGSLDAVLASSEREREREDGHAHEHEHPGNFTQSVQSTHSVPSSPTSLYSPLSPTPSFSWPKRVRSPEPHVPLRKASPERLHTRRGPPHPLFVTTNAGNQGITPATGRTAAMPHHTQVNAAAANQGKKWWEEPEEQVQPYRRGYGHGHGNGHQDGHQDGHQNGFDRGQEQGHRNGSGPAPQQQHQYHGNNTNILPRSRQTSDADTESARNISWPLSPTSDTFAGETLSSRKYTPPLKNSQSMNEGLRRPSNPNKELHQPGFGPDRISPILREAPSVPEHVLEEVRTSFRSALTSNSSHMSSVSGTARSSIITADSSMSDFVKIDSSWADATGDENFTVDDALDMYLGGFGTPVHSAKPSLDVRRESFPRASHESSASLRPHPAPIAGDRPSLSGHRRSQSATSLSYLRSKEKLEDPLPSPGGGGHIRTSTQIIAGRDVPSTSSSQAPSVASLKLVPRDRYGFKKISHYVTLEQYEAWEKPYNEHVERRAAKWNILMKNYGFSTNPPTRFPAKSDKIKRYIRKGIPPTWRGAAWFWYAGGPGLLKKDEGLYWKLLEQVRDGKLGDTDREHIERDLNRTFPDNVRFKPDPTTVEAQQAQASGDGSEQPETSMVRALRRVLQAFAVHNPSIGYCQSLNFIAGLLLLFLDEDEEKAFVLLNVVTSEHLPGTHGVALEGANIDIAVLMASIKESLPGVWAKLDDQSTPGIGGPVRLPTVSLATTAWFMSLFVGTLPIESVLRVWDCLFFEGSKTLFRVALAIFKAGEQRIKSINDPMEIFQVVQSMPRGMVDANNLMECCFRKRGGFGMLSQDVVERRREEGRVATREGRAMTDESIRRIKIGRAIGTVRLKSKMKGG